MKKLLVILILLLNLSLVFGQQDKVDAYVKDGIQYHDKGEYKKAVKVYKKALDIDPDSPLVNYELSMSYMALEDYKKVIKYADKALKTKGDHMIAAYMTKGSALDMLGKTKESIKLFKKAIKRTGGHYLLAYNLSLNYFKIEEFDESEKYAVMALEENPAHPTSHLILANIHSIKGNKIYSILANHFFLLLEPNTARSQGAFELLISNFNGNTSKNEDGDGFTIGMDMENKNEFSHIELMLGLLSASRDVESNEGLSDMEVFTKNTASIFGMIHEIDSKEKENIYWELYIPYLYDLSESEHFDTYMYLISQSGNKSAHEWIQDNKEKVEALDEWLSKSNE